MNASGYLVRMATAAATDGMAAVVVAPSADLRYLTGYDPMPFERPTLLVLRPDRDPILFVPQLERALADASPIGGAIAIVGWADGSDPYADAARLLPDHGRVAISDRTWASHVLGLQRAAPGLAFGSATPAIGALRAIKDAEELDALRRAGAAADATFDDVISLSFAGRPETAIAADLAGLLVEHGHATAEFTIVASGPNGASPHHEPGPRTLGDGDVVVMDFGGRLDGYHSDTTRTVVVGEPSPVQRRVHALVLEAQRAGVATVHPGVPIEEVDRAARGVIADGGESARFIHRTGHGIGLEVHEPPYAVEGDATVLAAGMTFSVEPGIYVEGAFGVRIEDIVAVTDDGVEELNRSSRELVSVS
jgi:D-alanyl-D-alanine dipeptidase